MGDLKGNQKRGNNGKFEANPTIKPARSLKSVASGDVARINNQWYELNPIDDEYTDSDRWAAEDAASGEHCDECRGFIYYIGSRAMGHKDDCSLHPRNIVSEPTLVRDDSEWNERIVSNINSQIGTDALLAVSARDKKWWSRDNGDVTLAFRFGPTSGLQHWCEITYRKGVDDYEVNAYKIRRNGKKENLKSGVYGANETRWEGVYASELGMLVRDANNSIL